MKNRIKQIRKHFKLSQGAFGEKIGVTFTAISKIEIGENNVSNQIASAICKEFNVSKEWLETGNGEMFREMTTAELMKNAVNKIMQTDNQFIINTLLTMSEMSENDLAIMELFFDKMTRKD